MTFPKEEIQKWIDALRNGEYTQTRLYLQNEKGHCCLGVACEVLIPKERQERDIYGFLRGSFPYAQPHAPGWLRAINTDFRLKTGKTLAELNDSGEYTFDDIADLLQAVYIEEVLG